MKKLLFSLLSAMILVPLCAQDVQEMEDAFFGGDAGIYTDTVASPAPVVEQPKAQPSTQPRQQPSSSSSSSSTSAPTRRRQPASSSGSSSGTTSQPKPVRMASSGIDWRNTEYAITWGIGIQTLVGATEHSNENYLLRRKPTIAWRVGANISFPLPVGLWMIDAALGSRGYEANEKLSGARLKEDYYMFNFQLAPFMYAYHFDLGGIAFRPFIGPYLGLDYAGFYKTELKYGSYKDKQKRDIWDKSEKGWVYYDEKGNRHRIHEFVDFGLNFGSNMYFGPFFMGVLFQTGFLQDTKEGYRKLTGKNFKTGSTFNFLLTMGYVF